MEFNCWIINTQTDIRMDDSSTQTTIRFIAAEGSSYREGKNDEPLLHLAFPLHCALSTQKRTTSLLPPTPLLLHSSSDEVELKQTLDTNSDTHRKHGAMRRLSITRGLLTDLCTEQSYSGTLRYEKHYLNHLLHIFTTCLLANGVLHIFIGRCFLGDCSSCCREKELVSPVCTSHIIFKPKHIIACLESRACKQKNTCLTFVLTAQPSTISLKNGNNNNNNSSSSISSLFK